MRRKILFVSHSSDLYGAERSLATLVNSLSKSQEFDVYLALPGNGKLESLLDIGRDKLFKLPYSKWIVPNRYLAHSLSIPIVIYNVLIAIINLKRIKSIKPDVVYTNTLATPFGFILSTLLKIKHVWHIREFVKEDINRYFALGDKLSMKIVSGSSAVIFNSKAVFDKFSPMLNNTEARIIYNGISLNPDEYLRPSTKYRACVKQAPIIQLYIVGYLQEGKGQIDAIKSLVILRRQFINVELHIVGSGKKRYINRLKTISKQLNVSDYIVWHGPSHNIKNHLQNAALLLICSKSEAFGRIAIEAMSQGTPVIGTNAGGLPEIITEETGLTYEPGNHVELADQIKIMLTDESKYAGYSTNAYNYISKKFTVESYVSQISNLLDNI